MQKQERPTALRQDAGAARRPERPPIERECGASGEPLTQGEQLELVVQGGGEYAAAVAGAHHQRVAIVAVAVAAICSRGRRPSQPARPRPR